MRKLTQLIFFTGLAICTNISIYGMETDDNLHYNPMEISEEETEQLFFIGNDDSKVPISEIDAKSAPMLFGFKNCSYSKSFDKSNQIPLDYNQSTLITLVKILEISHKILEVTHCDSHLILSLKRVLKKFRSDKKIRKSLTLKQIANYLCCNPLFFETASILLEICSHKKIVHLDLASKLTDIPNQIKSTVLRCLLELIPTFCPEAIKSLNLANNKLRIIPINISKFPQLHTLILSKNDLTSASLPQSLSQLPKLERLYLANNYLTFIPPFICNITTLKRLKLYGNNLSTLPTSLQNLTNLERLWVDSQLLWCPVLKVMFERGVHIIS